MKSTIRGFINFFVIIVPLILLTYISVFTDIPLKTRNYFEAYFAQKDDGFEEYSKDFNVNKLSIKMNTYYYNLLNDAQKKIYSSIANGVKNFKDEFIVKEYIASDKESFAKDVNVAIESFINDHPEAFYIKSEYSSYVVSSFEGNYGYIKLNYTEDSVDKIKEKIDMMETNIKSYLKGTDSMTQYEKELYIHDKLSYDVKYSKLEELPRAYHTSEGTLLEKIGVCDSFTKALQLIYDKAGIDSIIVLGSLNGSPHAWNMVKIDEEWYHVDLTSSHSIFDETGIVNHAYFNLTTEQEKKVATIDNEEILPNATSNKYNYYNMNDIVITKDESIYERLDTICDKYKEKGYIEFYLEGSVGERISTVLSALKRIDKSFVNDSKMYYYNIQNAIIIQKN